MWRIGIVILLDACITQVLWLE